MRTEAVSLADTYCYRNCLIYADWYANGDSYAYCYTNGDSYSYPDNYTWTDTYCQTPTNAEAASYAGATTVSETISAISYHRSAHLCELSSQCSSVL